MADTIVVIEPEGSGRRLIFHVWSNENERLSTEVGETPSQGIGGFQVQSREVPENMQITLECAGGLSVPKDGSGQYQDVSMRRQVDSLKALRRRRVKVTTRTTSFTGLMKTVEKVDRGKWDDSGILVTITVQVIVTGQTGLRLNPDGTLALPDTRQIQLALPIDDDNDDRPGRPRHKVVPIEQPTLTDAEGPGGGAINDFLVDLTGGLLESVIAADGGDS